MASTIQTAAAGDRGDSMSTAPKAPNGTSDAKMTRPSEIPKETLERWKTSKEPSKKYRHVTAFHSKAQASCLSHESEAAPSFLGFRNLMVLVLSSSITAAIVAHENC